MDAEKKKKAIELYHYFDDWHADHINQEHAAFSMRVLASKCTEAADLIASMTPEEYQELVGTKTNEFLRTR